ncbi:MAG TPA: glycosyltransferase family 2 protein [Rhizomicrobium sp.]|nr:glycosyltransferase family 2 protein [Rhizomicrobium sp.]
MGGTSRDPGHPFAGRPDMGGLATPSIAMSITVTPPCDVSIIMPCLDEARTIADCVANARAALEEIRRRYGLSGEVLVADNGSRDGSVALATEAGARVVAVPDKGYGNCLIGGFRAAAGRYLVMGDADGSYDFRESVAMVGKLIEGHALCFGTRLRGRIMPGAMPLKNRYIGNPALTGILNLLFRSRLSDAHSGMRALTREAFDTLRLTSPGMEFASEMLIKASLMDLPRTEVPITLHPDKRGRPPHLRPWRDGWRHLRYILILAPDRLFLWPALVMGILAMSLALPILLLEEGARIGHFIFGPHWMIMACTGAVISHILLLFGMAGLIYGVQAGYRKPPGWWPLIARFSTLESSLMIGGAITMAGLAGIIAITLDWIGVDFASPNKIRELVASCALLVIGVQHMFGGFLLAIIGGNRADYLSAAARTPSKNGLHDV